MDAGVNFEEQLLLRSVFFRLWVGGLEVKSCMLGKTETEFYMLGRYSEINTRWIQVGYHTLNENLLFQNQNHSKQTDGELVPAYYAIVCLKWQT